MREKVQPLFPGRLCAARGGTSDHVTAHYHSPSGFYASRRSTVAAASSATARIFGPGVAKARTMRRAATALCGVFCMRQMGGWRVVVTSSRLIVDLDVGA